MFGIRRPLGRRCVRSPANADQSAHAHRRSDFVWAVAGPDRLRSAERRQMVGRQLLEGPHLASLVVQADRFELRVERCGRRHDRATCGQRGSSPPIRSKFAPPNGV